MPECSQTFFSMVASLAAATSAASETADVDTIPTGAISVEAVPFEKRAAP